jgi:hypothetical protein
VYLSPIGEHHAVRRDLLRTHSGHHLDAAGDQLGAGRGPESGVEFCQDMRPRFEQYDPDPVRVDVRIVGSQGFVDEGVDLGGNLYPRGAAPYDDEGQRRVRDLAVREGGLLEAFDHPVADA